MRVAALAFGVLAGLVASLILALGGLDVTADLATAGERQVQAIRFGLLVVGNLGIFGAALVIASPLAGGIALVVAAIAWVGAALVTHHTTDFVLITPPALLLVAAILAGIAYFRRPRTETFDDEPEVEIIAPERADRMAQRQSDPMCTEDEEMGIPAFAAESSAPPSRNFDDDRMAPRADDWNPRRRQPPPPRTKPPFRPIEDEYDDEPSGFSRFALGLSSILSFGLYAALAGAAVLVLWNFRDIGSNRPATVVAEAEVSSPASNSSPPPSSASSAPASPVLVPALPSREPSREAAPVLQAVSQLPPLTQTSSAPRASEEEPDQVAVLPTLPANSGTLSSSAPAAEPSSVPPRAASSEPPPTPEPVVAAVEPVAASVPAAGQPFPRVLPAQLAALRQSAGPGVTTVATPRPRANNTGL